VTHGRDRGAIAYREREPEAKTALLLKINEERVAAGVAPLEYDLVGAKAGDDFCAESARTGSVGHWDVEGRAPYLRWALAGGVDHHAENLASVSRTGFAIRDSAKALLLDAHARMMAETPPDNGHRQTVLSPLYTHVGIGLAVVGGEFRMTEEYSRRVAEWIAVPEGPVPAGTLAPFALKLPSGWNPGVVEIAYEPAPKPLSLQEIARRGAYEYPRTVTRLFPMLPSNLRWASGDRGDFPVNGDRLDIKVPLTSGPGHYYVLVYAGRGETSGKPLSPMTGALIVAE
jgi:hypothetical protein